MFISKTMGKKVLIGLEDIKDLSDGFFPIFYSELTFLLIFVKKKNFFLFYSTGISTENLPRNFIGVEYTEVFLYLN